MIEAIKMAGCPILGAMGGHMIGAVTITGETLVPIGATVGVIGTVIALTWKVAQWNSTMENHSKELSEIKEMIKTRPCMSGLPCHPVDK